MTDVVPAASTAPASQVISVPDRSRPFSNLCLTIQRGSIDDPPDKAGVAWLTAQMLLRGAEGISRQSIADALEGLGSVVDLSVGRDHTMLWADALTRKRAELLAWLDRLLATPTFSAAELDKLRRETIADIQAVRDDDSALGLRFFVRALYGDHPYGRPLKGTETSLARIDRGDLIAFHRRWTRDGAMLGLSGDVDPAASEALAARLSAPLAAGPAAPRSVPPMPDGTAPRSGTGKWRVVLVDKPERTQTQVFIGHTTLTTPLPGAAPHEVGVHHPDWTALQVGQTTFGGTFTSRLSHEIREKRGWSYGAWSQVSADQRLGTFLMRFYPSATDLLPALQLTDELLSAFVADGPTDAELDAAQSYLQNGFVFSIDTASRRLSELLSARLLGHPDGWVDGTVDRLREIPHTHATRAVKAHIRPDDMIVAIVGTAKDLEPQLRAWSRIGDIQVIDWKTSL